MGAAQQVTLGHRLELCELLSRDTPLKQAVQIINVKYSKRYKVEQPLAVSWRKAFEERYQIDFKNPSYPKDWDLNSTDMPITQMRKRAYADKATKLTKGQANLISKKSTRRNAASHKNSARSTRSLMSKNSAVSKSNVARSIRASEPSSPQSSASSEFLQPLVPGQDRILKNFYRGYTRFELALEQLRLKGNGSDLAKLLSDGLEHLDAIEKDLILILKGSDYQVFSSGSSRQKTPESSAANEETSSYTYLDDNDADSSTSSDSTDSSKPELTASQGATIPSPAKVLLRKNTPDPPVN